MINNYQKSNEAESAKNRATSSKLMKSLLFLFVMTLLMISSISLVACKPVDQTPQEERPVGQVDENALEPEKIDLSFDPLGASGDALNVPDALRDSVRLSLKLSGAAFDSTIDAEAMRTHAALSGLTGVSGAVNPQDTVAYDTYRIQLYNSRVYAEAALERSVATEIFDYTVTLDYEVPYFKIRLGDFADSKVAEVYLKDYVKPAGYPDSWVARVRVTPQKSAEAQERLTVYFDSLRTAILLEGLDIDALDSLGVLDSLLGEGAIDTTTSFENDSEGDSEDDSDDDSEGGEE